MAKKDKHIPSQKHSPKEEEWLKYLKHELSEEDAHAIETSLLDSEFEWEAMEGLEQFENPESLDLNLQSIKTNILKKVKTNKYPRRNIHFLGDLKWSVLTLIIIIVIAVLAMMIIHWLMHK